MEENLPQERREALIDMFSNIVRSDVLIAMEALTIVNILEGACQRASVDLEEGILKAMIEGGAEDGLFPES